MGEVKTPSLQYGSIGQMSGEFGSSGSAFETQGTQSTPSSGTASRIGEAAKQRLSQEADARKSLVTSQLGEIAGVLDELASSLGNKGVGGSQFASMAASRVRQFSDSIEGRSADELLQTATTRFKESPVPILLGFIALGFVGARLVRT